MTAEQIEYFRQWVDLETRGEAICRTHAQRTQDADQRGKWMALAELESATKAVLVRYLRANGIAVEESADKRREGEVVAGQSASVAWRDLWANWRPRIALYVDELRAVALAAPVEQRTLASRLCEHEEAWLAFIDRELAGDPETSIAPIRAHLEKWQGRDGERAGDSRSLA
jgi:hypothetical protein